MSLYDTVYPIDEEDALDGRLRLAAIRDAKRHALDWREIADDNRGTAFERECRELARQFEREAEGLQCPAMAQV